MNETKSKMFVVLDKKGNLVAASLAPPPNSGAVIIKPSPIDPDHTVHEMEVPHALAVSPTLEKIQAAAKTLMQTVSAKGVKVSKLKRKR